jgi:hypothetical protein
VGLEHCSGLGRVGWWWLAIRMGAGRLYGECSACVAALVLVPAMFINRRTLPPGLIRKPAGWWAAPVPAAEPRPHWGLRPSSRRGTAPEVITPGLGGYQQGAVWLLADRALGLLRFAAAAPLSGWGLVAASVLLVLAPAAGGDRPAPSAVPPAPPRLWSLAVPGAGTPGRHDPPTVRRLRRP